MMNEEKMLSQVTAISQKYDLLNKHTGGYFNIFDIVDSSHNEVVICRVIHELLSPTGNHYQKDNYLKLFFESVLKTNISDEEIKTARVHREYQITNDRRIDLVIETRDTFIPIEVKIYASDQNKQCYDYYQYAKNSMLYYLTPNGIFPSTTSANGLTENEISCISFESDIIYWLELCLKDTATVKIAPIREIILQFINTIRKFTGQVEGDTEMEIKELITSSSENMKSAISIENALNDAKQSLMLNIFKTIENKVNSKKLENEYDFEYSNCKKVKEYYQRKGSSYPGISYLYKDKTMANTEQDIWVRLEIENDIVVGYCCPVDGKATSKTLSDVEIKTILNVEPNIGDWWAYSEFCPDDKKEESPNFKNFNDSYFDLFDNEKLQLFTDKVAKRILELLSQ